MPRVSVIMPVWNTERFLLDAIRSIQQQTFGDFELIIVDDGSADRSVEMIRDLASQDRRIRVVFRAHSGVAAASNAGMYLAVGEYLARMDSDDVAYPERLQEQVDFLDSHPDHVMVGSRFEEITADGRPVQSPGTPFYTEDDQLRRHLLINCAFVHSSVMLRRSAFHDTGGYRRALEGAMDYDLFVRVAQRGKIANLNAIRIKSRHHVNQVSCTRLERQMISAKAVQHLARKLARGDEDPFAGAVDPLTKEQIVVAGIPERDIDMQVLDAYENFAVRTWLDGDKTESAALLWRAFEYARRSGLTRNECARYGFQHAKYHLRQSHFGAAAQAALSTWLSAPFYPFAWVARRLTRARLT